MSGDAPPPAARHRAGVIGSPIGHSLSPTLYRAGYAAAGLHGWEFEALECGADGLPSLMRSLGEGWAGVAVTMPGKHAAAAAADTRSARVEAMGAANTLVHDGGRWHAENTDVDGVVGALRAAGVAPAGSVLLLGGGGTARAVVVALAGWGWDGALIIAGRRPQSTAAAADLARRLGMPVLTIGLDPREISAVAGTLAIAVSTVPAGAADHLAPVLADVPALFDVVYHPWPTPLAAAGAPGRITVTGLDMLLHQALRQFTLITGRPAPADAMRAALLDATESDLPLPL